MRNLSINQLVWYLTNVSFLTSMLFYVCETKNIFSSILQVHVPGVGDFQFDKIDILEDPHPLNERQKHKKDHMQLDDYIQNGKVISIYCLLFYSIISMGAFSSLKIKVWSFS